MEGFEVMVTVTFLQFKLGSMETDTFVNIFGVGFHRRVGGHGDGDVFTTHAGFNGRGYVCEHLWSRVSPLNCYWLNVVHSTTRG